MNTNKQDTELIWQPIPAKCSGGVIYGWRLRRSDGVVSDELYVTYAQAVRSAAYVNYRNQMSKFTR